MDEVTRAALDRLLVLADSDTGQSRRAANFILAWWNAEALGGFDLADLFSVDATVARDMSRIFNYLATHPDVVYPKDRRPQIEAIMRRWRPEAWERAQS